MPKKRDPFNCFASISNLHLIRWLYKTPPINSHKSFLINEKGIRGIGEIDLKRVEH